MWVWLSIIPGLILAIRIYYRQISGVCHSKRRLDGKVAIVTGSSAGIGKETARDLAHRGARVILACRNIPKAQTIADDIIATTGNKDVVVRELDTSDLSSVRKFAKGILDSEPSLHILVNNAGILSPAKKTLTSDGLEITMATNHFGHFLMTNMLLGLMKSSAPSRIVNVTSSSHLWCYSLDPEDLNYGRRNYGKFFGPYGQSKLCNILFTIELADRLRGTGVTANCVHPGGVATEVLAKQDNLAFKYVFFPLTKLVMKDEKLGSQTTNYLAVAEEVENVSGEYFSDCKIDATSLIAKDRHLAKKLWEASERLVNLASEDLHYKGKARQHLSI